MSEKTDRELLELAAKAAGLTNAEWKEYTNASPTMVVRYERPVDGVTGYQWNPLTDDGDALRLAVSLRITHGATDVAAYADRDDSISIFVRQPLNGRGREPYSVYEATRRAIVRAAAAIGESMP